MTNLENLRLEDIAPDSIKIPDVLAFFNALDPELQKITQDIGEALIMIRIYELPEEIVDLLAWQFHVDFYEPLGLDLDRKRALVKNSLIWHRYKGTKYALESMIRILFFENFQIEEWFEYGGKPYFFRLIAWDSLREEEQYDDFIRAIYELKNERSWLEGLIFEREVESTIYLGVVGTRTTHFEIDGYAPKIKLDDITMHFGIVGRHTTVFEVIGTYPEQSQTEPLDAFVGFTGKRTHYFDVDGEDAPSRIAPVETRTGIAGKIYKHSNIVAEETATNVSPLQASTGLAHRHIRTTFIKSEEVENGDI